MSARGCAVFSKASPSFWVRIYASGPIDVAIQVVREFCLRGLCVSITPTRYIYTGGEESGYVVEFQNYPRFPARFSDIRALAGELAVHLLHATHQRSVMIVDDATTEWITRSEASATE